MWMVMAVLSQTEKTLTTEGSASEHGSATASRTLLVLEHSGIAEPSCDSTVKQI